jgi:hypothetical protein
MNENLISGEIINDLIEIFEVVKEVVRITEGRSRAGLMLGLQELGTSINGFIGAYYPIASNVIVINKTPLRRLLQINPNLLKAYGFHILLHEYIHSLGFLNEEVTRKKTYEISKSIFGKNHIITKLSTNIQKFFPHLKYPIYGYIPHNKYPPIEIVQGFDITNTCNYIN